MLRNPVLPSCLPPSSLFAHSSCCYMEAAAHCPSIFPCPKLLQPLCTSNGPNRASVVPLARGGCESPWLWPSQGTAPCQGEMLRGQILPWGWCQRCLLGPAWHLAGAGRPWLGG